MFMGWSVIITSGGASTAGTASRPEDPMCTFRTVPVSDSARHSGSQCSEWKLGYPITAGFSLNVSERHPLAATRRTSAAHASGSQIAGSAIGMNRPG